MLSLNLEDYNLFTDDVHFYYADINDFIPKVGNMQEWLTTEEKLRANRFKFLMDQYRFIIARGILRTLLAKYLEMDLEKILLEYSKYGKPTFDTDRNIKFNISHSGDMIVFGFVKKHEIGVDVELLKTDFKVMDIALKFFSKKEIGMLLAFPELKRELAFYRCWTRKESIIKAVGSGLSFPLETFSVSMDFDDKAELLETPIDRMGTGKWSLFSFRPFDNYLAAIAVNGDVDSLSTKKLILKK